MKKILFITAFPPSDIAAAEKNTKLMLEDLGRSYEVDLIYFKDADVEGYEPNMHTVRVKYVIANSKGIRLKNAILHPFSHPIFTVRFNGKLLKSIQQLVGKNDYSAIIFDHSQTFMYAKRIKFDGPKVLLSHDVEAQRFERNSTKLMTKFCKWSESYVLSVANAHVFTFCQKDVDLIREYYRVDAHLCLDYIDERITSYRPAVIKDEFVLLANWKRADNADGAVWLINGLSQYLRKNITVNIIGKNFPVDRLQENDKIKLNVLGFVDNPYPMIAESKAMFCPLFTGAGIKVKVIESLASGTPVIGTDIAFEGFSEKYDKFMLRAQDLEAFADEIERVDFSLEERLEFKEMFVKDYTSMTIPKWLEKNVKE